MLAKQEPEEIRMIAHYSQLLHLQDATFSRIDHEDAMIAVVYKVTQPNRNDLILKICPRAEDYQREIYFLTYLADRLPVPHVVQAIPPEANIPGAILMECLPGKLLKITDFTDALAFEVGAVLARLHLNPAAGYGDLTKPDQLTLDPRLYFTQKFDEELAECRHHLPKGLVEHCQHYHDAQAHLLSSVDGPCIVHRDFRPGNLLIDQGKLQGVIDWAGARGGFAEQDFGCMEHGEWPFHSATKKSFLGGYESIRPVPNYTAILPLLRLSRALGVIGYTVKQGTWENRDARIYQYNRAFLETFFM